MVYLGWRVGDCLKVYQEEALGVICPLARNPCLNKCKHRFSESILYITYQHIPLLYIIEGINSNTKVSYEAKDLNPK